MAAPGHRFPTPSTASVTDLFGMLPDWLACDLTVRGPLDYTDMKAERGNQHTFRDLTPVLSIAKLQALLVICLTNSIASPFPGCDLQRRGTRQQWIDSPRSTDDHSLCNR